MRISAELVWIRSRFSVVSFALLLMSLVSLVVHGQAKPVYVKPEEAMKLLVAPLLETPPHISSARIRMAKMSGTVRVEFTVTTNGTVADIVNLSPADSPIWLFETLRDQGVSPLRFHPYLQDGLPLAMRTSLQAVYSDGSGKWVWADPKMAPPTRKDEVTAAITAAMTAMNITTSQVSGASANSAYKGPNAEWLQMVLATVGPHGCGMPYQPPAPKYDCQRDGKIREAQMIAVTADCMAASGDETSSSRLATILMLDLKSARELCTKVGEPTTCDTDTVLACDRLPK